MTKIIAGFPGVGKSYAYNKLSEMGRVVYDSDSSTFDKADFPRNYIEHIKTILEEGKADYIFVSTHREVREALIKECIPFNIVYPNDDPETKEIYLNRYRERGSPEPFINVLDANFEGWIGEIKEIYETEYITKFSLSGKQTLFDLLEDRLKGSFS